MIFYSKHTNAPAALMMASPGKKLNKEDANNWCASLGYRLPNKLDMQKTIILNANWANYHSSANDINAWGDSTTRYYFHNDNNTPDNINVGQVLFPSGTTSGRYTGSITTNANPSVQPDEILLVVCIKDL